MSGVRRAEVLCATGVRAPHQKGKPDGVQVYLGDGSLGTIHRRERTRHRRRLPESDVADFHTVAAPQGVTSLPRRLGDRGGTWAARRQSTISPARRQKENADHRSRRVLEAWDAGEPPSRQQVVDVIRHWVGGVVSANPEYYSEATLGGEVLGLLDGDSGVARLTQFTKLRLRLLPCSTAGDVLYRLLLLVLAR